MPAPSSVTQLFGRLNLNEISLPVTPTSNRRHMMMMGLTQSMDDEHHHPPPYDEIMDEKEPNDDEPGAGNQEVDEKKKPNDNEPGADDHEIDETKELPPNDNEPRAGDHEIDEKKVLPINDPSSDIKMEEKVDENRIVRHPISEVVPVILELKEYKTENARLRDEIMELRDEIEDLRDEIKNLRGQVNYRCVVVDPDTFNKRLNAVLNSIRNKKKDPTSLLNDAESHIRNGLHRLHTEKEFITKWTVEYLILRCILQGLPVAKITRAYAIPVPDLSEGVVR